MRGGGAVAGGVIEFFVVGGVVGNMHLAVEPRDATGLVDDDGGIVVHAGVAALEHRRDHDHLMRRRDASQPLRRRSWNRLGQSAPLVSLRLAAVIRAKQYFA